MQEATFEQYMLDRNLAEKTRQQRGYALKRIEKAYATDLDAEYEKDRCASLIRSMSYSSNDDQAGLPNPSKLDIDPDKLLTHLRWYKSHVVDYARFKGGGHDADESSGVNDLPPAENRLIEEVVGKTFALERDLQSALRANISRLEPGLKVADGGSEKRVDAGFIDILARDENDVLTVIELKADLARPEAIAQILGYMGCVAEEAGEQVRGILVAGDFHPRVIFAASAVPNLILKKYRFQFEFE